MSNDYYKISSPRYLRCQDGKLRKGIIVTLSDLACKRKYVIYNPDGTERNGAQVRIINAILGECDAKFGYCRVETVTTVEYGSTRPSGHSYTIRQLKLTIGPRSFTPGISPQSSIKFNINLCQHSHERIS